MLVSVCNVHQLKQRINMELPVQLNEFNQHLPANQNRVFRLTMDRENCNTRFLPNSAISFRDRHILIENENVT